MIIKTEWIPPIRINLNGILLIKIKLKIKILITFNFILFL